MSAQLWPLLLYAKAAPLGQACQYERCVQGGYHGAIVVSTDSCKSVARNLQKSVHTLLAAEQPAANAVTLPLPFTLTLRYSMGSLLRFAGMLWIFLVVYFGFLGWIMNSAWLGDLIPMSEPLVMGVIVAVAGALLVLPVFLLRGRSYTIEVIEQGISMDVGGTLSFVRWEEARLFAVYHSLGARSDQSSLTYELSSMTDIVRWTEVVSHPATALLQMTPTIPLAQYQQQAQALNALVAARTGLPLFDLRKESALNKVSLKALNP